MSASKGVAPYNSASFRPSLSPVSDVFGDSTSTMQTNLEAGSSRCNIVRRKVSCTENGPSKTAVGLLMVHPKSSEVARKILEHLDRTVPSPQSKPFETKFLIEKNTLPPSGATKMLNGQGNKPCPGAPSTNFLLGDVVRGNAEVRKVNKDVSLGFKTSVTDSVPTQLQKSLSMCQSRRSECTSTISVSKAEKASSFPDICASMAFNASCEPLATPTVALHSSATDVGIIPSFSFGSIIGSWPILSFCPVAISTSNRDADSSIPPYRFGSNDSSRLSFRSFSNDAVRY